jgi:hypothetical protein
VLNSPSRPCGLHALHLQEVPAHVPTFAARDASVAGGGDLEVDGIVQHAPSTGLTGRQGGQIGEIATAAFPLRTGIRTDQGIKPDWPKWHTTDTAGSRCHLSLSPNRLSDILTAAGSFKWGAFRYSRNKFVPLPQAFL